jgi:hypothetical protein
LYGLVTDPASVVAFHGQRARERLQGAKFRCQGFILLPQVKGGSGVIVVTVVLVGVTGCR